MVPTVTGRPVVGISCCLRNIAFGDYPPLGHHTVFHRYVDYAVGALDVVPVLVPALSSAGDSMSWLADRLDGVLLTGSPSNVGVRMDDGLARYIQPVGQPDHARDATTASLIERCLAQGIPVLGICRGLQELNVARGGALHEELHSMDRHRDHRSDKTLDPESRYGPAHPLNVTGATLQRILHDSGWSGRPPLVNSLHSQGASTLGRGVVCEATADDGVIEAISIPGAAGFALGVQWHIEWGASTEGLDGAISRAFAAACVQRMERRRAAA